MTQWKVIQGFCSYTSKVQNCGCSSPIHWECLNSAQACMGERLIYSYNLCTALLCIYILAHRISFHNNFTNASILLYRWMDGWIFIKLTLDVGVWHERKQTDDFKTSKDTFECCHVSYTVLHTELVTVTCLLSCLKSYSLPPRPNLGINYRIVCIVFFPAHYAISLCSK